MPRQRIGFQTERAHRNLRGERSRLNILRTSARLFALRGYDNVSIRDIADAVDLVPSLIIHHFGTKALLFRKTINHYLGNGEVFMQATAPVLKANPTDKQAAANAIAESFHIFFDLLHGGKRIKHLDRLMIQVIFGRGCEDPSLALEWIGPFERIFENFFSRVAGITLFDADIRMEIFLSHIFYPAVCRNLLLAEHSWKEFPDEFLLAWKSRVTNDFCLGLGLPPPTFDYLAHPTPNYRPASASSDITIPDEIETCPAPRSCEEEGDAPALQETHAKSGERVPVPKIRFTLSRRVHKPAPAPAPANSGPPAPQ